MKITAVLTNLLALALTLTGLAQANASGPIRFQSSNKPYKSYVVGKVNSNNRHAEYGLALIGGGDPITETFQWMAEKADHGDFLIIRFTDDPWMNEYVPTVAQFDSIETLVVPSREAANHPDVIRKILSAEAIYFPGGDQWNYISNWKDTQLLRAFKYRVKQGIPVGGTSAGLAIMGQIAFSAEKNTVYSEDTLINPMAPDITLIKDFLQLPMMSHILTDTHFKARDRMGRFLTFLARSQVDNLDANPVGLAVDENTALLLEANGQWVVVGEGAAYKAIPSKDGLVCQPGTPLSMSADIVKMVGRETSQYRLTVENGVIKSDQSNGEIY